MVERKGWSYHILAQYYNVLSEDRDWKRWSEFTANLLKMYSGKETLKVLDAACGTGIIAVSFQKMGFQVLGVDLSVGMLAQADVYNYRQKAGVRFVCQDLKELDLQEEFDAAVCLCDSLNYLTNKRDLSLAVCNIASHLKKGGLFLFDVNTQEKLANLYGNNVYADHQNGFSYIWMNEYDRSKAVVTMHLTFFVEAEDGFYRRFDEVHREKAYRREEILSVITKAGLELLGCGEELGEPPEPIDQRVFYLTRKL
jgi:SAM-dependent methyltransferase